MIFSRWGEPNAPTAMLEAATARGWQQVAPPALVGLQPPVLARVDVEGLSGRFPTACEYWAAASPDGMLASHLSVVHDEYDTASFDMVAWDDPAAAATLPHIELALHGHDRQHHRLTDRFQPHGSTTVAVSSAGWRLTVRRDCHAPAVTALAIHPALGSLAALLDQDRGGARLDVLGSRCALWRLTPGPRRGRQRWRALLDASSTARQILADSSTITSRPPH